MTRKIKDAEGRLIAIATAVRRRGPRGGWVTVWRVVMLDTRETWTTDLFRTAEREARATAERAA